jgi:Uncharacterized conserved protein (DUF2088).
MRQELRIVAKSPDGLNEGDIKDAVRQTLELWGKPLSKVLLVPPDITRFHSGAGEITCQFYKELSPRCDVRVLPAVGTHEAMTQEEAHQMFPEVPYDKFVHHSWRDSVDRIGTITPDNSISKSLVRDSVPIEINRKLLEPWDLIVSIGQVVPHEVAGMANYTKNIAIGCGGKAVIDHSHMLSAEYGIEKTLGEVDTPVRLLLDQIQKEHLSSLPLIYVLTVMDQSGNDIRMQGYFAGQSRATFEAAAELSRSKNIFQLKEPLSKVVVWLDPKKFKTTWLGNKAIYRTRMALKDDAQLIVLAPGVRKFGEDPNNDTLIRKYGYRKTEEIMEFVENNDDLRKNLSVAAHLIHGSTEGRFTVKYAVSQMNRDEIESVGYDYLNYTDVENVYPVSQWTDGIQTLADGESVYYISNPGLGLWKSRLGVRRT